MTSQQLQNLVKTGQLKEEPGSREEMEGLLHSGRVRLQDARSASLSLDSRFDLAYNAAHALALAALRWHGYRSDKRYLVFQVLPQTLGVGQEVWRVLALCHERRNLGEYEGHLEVDEQLMADLLKATETLLSKVDGLPEP